MVMEIKHNMPLDMMENGSKLRIYSIGIVAENKKMSHSRIMVSPIESLGMADGELKSSPEKPETKGLDYDFKEYTVSTITDTAVEAEWLPMNGGNRRTPPDVRRGERVILWQFGDEARFWWTTYGLDGRLRKLETVIYSISGTKDEKEDSERPENSYYMEMSSHEKRITISTSKKNGEFCRYGIQIDPGQGKVLIVDDQGNEMMMDSKATRLFFKNADGTELDMNKKDITGKAAGKITLKAPDITLDGKLKVTGTSKFDAKITATGIQSSAAIQGPTDTI